MCTLDVKREDMEYGSSSPTHTCAAGLGFFNKESLLGPLTSLSVKRTVYCSDSGTQ